MKKVPLGLEFSLLINVEVFINSAKLIILVKINSVFSGIYILQSALLSTSDKKFLKQQRKGRKYIQIFKQTIKCLITIK